MNRSIVSILVRDSKNILSMQTDALQLLIIIDRKIKTHDLTEISQVVCLQIFRMTHRSWSLKIYYNRDANDLINGFMLTDHDYLAIFIDC